MEKNVALRVAICSRVERRRHNILSEMNTSFIIIIISTIILTLQWFAVEGFIVYTGQLQQQLVLPRSLISLSAESSDTSSKEEVVTAKPTKTVTTTKIPKSSSSSSKNRISVNDNNNESTQQQPRQQQFQSMQTNEEFELSCRVHTTITLLRRHFSSLLELPSLSESTAKWIYDSTNVTVVGPRGELLAVGIDEVIRINRALALSSTAARRAGSLLDLAVNGGGDAAIGSSSKVECELILDPNNNQQLKILVLWKTRLPNTGFSGRSIVYLSPQTGLVTHLQIEQVKINGVEVLDSLGTALATLRTASRSASSSIFDGFNSVAGSRGSRSTGNPLFDGIMSGIQEVVDAVEALPSEKTDHSLGAPLYVLPEHLWKNKTVFVGDEDDDSNEASASLPTPIDEYNMGQMTPMAGSDQFVEYEIVIKSLQNFATYALGRLAGGFESSESTAGTEVIREMFTTEAVLVTSDKDGDDITLLRGGGKVTDFYRSLSVLRGASGGDWKVINVDSNLGQRKLIVEWETDAPFKVMGKDAFIFETPELLALPLRLPMNTDGDIDDIVARGIQFFDESNDEAIPLKVDRVESLQLMVAGASADSEWAQSFVNAALRSGVVGNTIPDPTITELLRSLTTKQSVKTAPKRAKPAAKSMPPLNDAAASSFYEIIRSLHNDLPSIIADVEMKGKPQTPAEAFLADSIELRGLLGEILIRGSESYNRLFGVVISSLRAAVRTNRVRLAAKPKPTIEITPNGSIKMGLVVALWIDAPTFPGQSKSNNGGFGVPLKIEISSLYKIDEAGKIREHQILESRLNGMLTPGDVFSRWIKSVASSDETKREDAGVNFASSFLDALSWVRSQSRK